MTEDQSKYTKKKYNDPLDELLQRPVAYHPAFARMLGSTVAGVMLSQGLYWQARVKSVDGYWWKTAEEWEEETGLNQKDQEDARRILRQTTFWFEDRRGVPATLYFFVDKDNLLAELSGETHKEMTLDELIEGYGVVFARLSKAAFMRARKMKAVAEYVDYSLILKRDQAICQHCRQPITRGPGKFDDALHFDHLLPLPQGGQHIAENVVCSHAACSLHKEIQISYAKKTGLITTSEQDGLTPRELDGISQRKQVSLPQENLNKESEITSEITSETTQFDPVFYQKCWERVLEQIKPDTPRASFSNYIEGTRTVRFDGNTLEILAPSKDAREWLESRVTNAAERLLVGILKEEVKVMFVVGEEVAA